MNLLLSVPTGVLADTAVLRVTAEADFGSFVLLPRHADTAAVLVPGLLAWHLEDGQEVFAAVDHGILVKAGDRVRVAAQRAVVTGELGKAEAAVRDRFLVRSEQQKRARSALIGLESEILRRVSELGG